MDSSIQQYWSQCLDFIRDNLSMEQFKTWFTPIVPVSYSEEEKKLTIAVPSSFFYEFLEEHYLDLMKAALNKVFGESICLMYEITIAKDATNAWESSNTTLKKLPVTDGNKAPKPQDNTADLDPRLNPIYNFNNFIEGDSNKLSRQIGLSIAEKPSHTPFNPLFIYGPSGVGKTHLVNAIGAQIKQSYPQLRVLYISAHLFMVQYTDSVRNNTYNDFINFYQTIDVLIVDDMQELSGVTKTQNIFFHIFNNLHQLGKQIILTADRSPVEMQGFEDRLLTRFKWGMTAELERPGEDLRRKILTSKIRKDGLDISDDVVNYIAHAVKDSVRDLEGVIHSLIAYSVVYNCDLNMQLAEKVVNRTVRYEQKKITIETILQHTCEAFHVSLEDVYGQCRKSNIVRARQVSMFLAQKYTNLSTSRIGTLIGKKNHATVLHSIKLIQNEISMNVKDLCNKINEIELELKN